MGDYKLYAEDESYKLYQGKMQDVIDNCLEENSIDCILTDPPYGLTSITERFGKEGSAPAKEGTDGAFKRLSRGFMNQLWDGTGVEYDVETWKRCLKVLKPGGYLLAFGGTRTYHRIACAIEDAGFEIRDCIIWLYGSGFPKSLNIGLAIDKKNGVESIDTGIVSPNARPNCTKENTLFESGTVGKNFNIKKATNKWDGWGTQLKPCYEPIIVARKPFSKSLVDNVLEYGVGALNIDECRIEHNEKPKFTNREARKGNVFSSSTCGFDNSKNNIASANENGRFPGNVIHDGSEEATQFMPNTKGSDTDELGEYGYTFEKDRDNKPMAHGYNDEGSAARYFYCAKANSKDRDEGLEDFEKINIYKDGDASWGYNNTQDDNYGDRIANVKRANIHPTVKPTDLMQYLVRLVAPKGATILDCFMGSGSTGKAVMFENRERNANYKFIGIEMTEEYLPICEARIKWAKYKYEYELKKEEQEMASSGQKSLF